MASRRAGLWHGETAELRGGRAPAWLPGGHGSGAVRWRSSEAGLRPRRRGSEVGFGSAGGDDKVWGRTARGTGGDGARHRRGWCGSDGKFGQLDGVSGKKNAPPDFKFSEPLGARIYIVGICTGGLAYQPLVQMISTGGWFQNPSIKIFSILISFLFMYSIEIQNMTKFDLK